MDTSFQIFPSDKASNCFGDSPALISGPVTLDYSAYNSHVDYIAQKLDTEGVMKGDRVAILSENIIYYPMALFSILRTGAVALPLNIHYPERKILNIIKELDIKFLIISPNIEKPAFDKTCKVFYINKLTDLDKEKISDKNFSEQIRDDQDATIFLTSGSTSAPKAVLHTLAHHLYSAESSNRNIPFQAGDSWLLSLPVYHVGGISILFRAVLGGGAVIIPDDDESIEEALKKYSISHLSLVSTQLFRLLEDPENIGNLQKLKAVILGGGTIPAKLTSLIHKYELPVYCSYGMTEFTSQIATSAIREFAGRDYIGAKVLDHCEIKIADDGEILVKGRSMFRGYLTDNKLIQPFDNAGWFATGDTGFLDAEGYLRLTGRKDNMFISGGENIQPENIEREINKIEGIIDSVVVPVSDDEYGSIPVAFIRMEHKADIDEKEFKNVLRNALPGLMIPVRFLPFPEENTGTGIKSGRKELTEIAEGIIKSER
ncbi:o-succinylbenzoate--CoA ligase [candidate division KSB1 bacterium]